MNLENIKEGMEIKNYKELCALLETETKAGKGRQLQLEKFSNYFEYEKDKHKFIITKIYTEAEIQHKQINKSRKSVYGHMIEILLMDMLSKNKGNIIVSKNTLSKELGLTNDNYNLGYNNQLKVSNYMNIDLKYVNNFYNINNSNITSILNTALNSLHNRRIIDYENIVMVKYRDKRTAHKATPFDRALLLEIDKECMLEFGIKSLEELNRFNTNKRYFELKNKRSQLIQERTNIEYHYKAFDIVINHKFIEQEKKMLTDYVLEEMDRLKTMIELNSTYSDNVIINAEKRFNSDTENKYNNNYVDVFKNMVQEFLLFEAKKITLSDLHNMKIELLNSSDLPF